VLPLQGIAFFWLSFPLTGAHLRNAPAGKPLAWFGNFALPYAMYVPAALAGAWSAYLPSERDPVQATLGQALLSGALSCVLTLTLGLGSGFIFAFWSGAALFCSWLAPLVGRAQSPIVVESCPLN
jgi:hypothetical protein